MTEAENKSGLFLDAEIGEALVELGQLTAGIDQTVNAGPCRMRFGVDIKTQRIAGLAPGGAGLEFAAVGHDHINFMVVGMDVVLHGALIFKKIEGASI